MREWVKTVEIVAIRLSKMACPRPDSGMELVVFPTAAMIREWSGVLHYLVGVVYSSNYSTWPINWILSNGARTQLPDEFDLGAIK